MQVGEAREARCHLLQGAKIAEAFRLPCRSDRQMNTFIAVFSFLI